MIKKILALLLICFSSFCAYSQREIRNGVVVDKQAENIITNTSNRIKQDSPLSLDFNIKVKDKSSSKLEKGSILINKNKYIATFSDNKIYCDGKDMWVYQKDVNEVTINSFDNSGTDIINISKFLEQANKNYRAKLIREEKGDYIIDLLPNKIKDISKIRIRINKQLSRIVELNINYKNGGNYTYNISNYKTKVSVKDSDFIFNKAKFPKVNVVDLR